MPTPDLTPAQRHTRRTLRQHLRQRRRALTPGAQDAAARALARQLSRLPALRNARRIAVYQSADGEIDPQALFRQSGWRHRDLALPALPAVGAGPLTFIRWNHRTRLRLNRFGISEPRPDRRHAMPAWTQDVVLLPLVAFDREGNRLGMGGGFYDRTLADLARRPRRPLLLGVAHHFQGVDRLPAAPWDVPLDGIVTDREYFVTG